jgi:putative ABC transport system permease protein
MRFLIHGIKSLVRRPAKTVMLFIILFVVFNLIFTGFIIQNSIDRSKDYIRSQIGCAVEYRMDFSKLMEVMRQGNGQLRQNIQVPALSLQVAEKIAANAYVASYYVSEAANVSSTAADPAQTQSQSGDFQRNFSEFTLSGTNREQNLSFVLGQVKLTAGRNLTADELKNGSKVIMVSDEVAAANDLQIGDSIDLTRVSQQAPGGRDQMTNPSGSSASGASAQAADYEIIGIYQAVQDDADVNTFYTSNAAVTDINGTTASDETSGSIVFLLDDPSHVDAFKQAASPYLTSEYHVLYSDDTEYQTLTRPLNLLALITSILITVVFVAGAAIIMALVTIFVRDRKFEIGLLLSSGESRTKIVGQFVFEMLVIAIVAFAVSALSSSIISIGVSSWIVDSQLLSQTSLISTSTASTNLPAQFQNLGGRFGQSSVSLYGAVNMQNVADRFDVSINAAVIGRLMLASIALVLFGACIPLFSIMRYRPRQIMQDDN